MRLHRVLTLPGLHYRLIAAVAAGYGASLFSLSGSDSPATLTVALDTLSAVTWAWVFLVASALYLATMGRRWTAAPLTAVLVAWSAMLGWAGLTSDNASPGAWLPWAGLAAILLVGHLRDEL